MGTRKLIKSALTWIGRIGLALLLLLLGLIVFMLIRESIARSRYQADYPPPGQMVSLDTHDIHLNCVGNGDPIVVLEADLDTLGSLSWSRVQNEVGNLTRTCSYDRAGFMWSEPGPRPRDGAMIVSELKAVLEAAGEDSPYLLVGHAMGGAYVRIFAGQYPDDVCGMVLVDSAHPDQVARMAEVGIGQEMPSGQIRPLISLFTYMGIPGRNRGQQYNMPEEVYAAQQAFLPQSSLAWFDESVEGMNTLAQAGQVSTLGELPLIVLASARPAPAYAQVEGQDPQTVRLELQRELTWLSENSEIRLFEDVGHYIQFDSPEVVISAIQDVIDMCHKP